MDQSLSGALQVSAVRQKSGWFFSLQMNDGQNLKACLSMHFESLQKWDRIVKQFWIEKKSTRGKKTRVFLDAHSALNRTWIAVQYILSATAISVMLEAHTPHLLRAVGATHCKSREEKALASS